MESAGNVKHVRITHDGSDRVLPVTRWVAAIIVPFLVAAFIILYLFPDHTLALFAWGIQPRMSAMMRRVQTAVAELPDVRLVSFSVDPARDTPPVLAEYATRYRAQPGRWFFLTGDVKTLDALDRRAFMLGNVDGSLEHSTRFVLVDRHGRIRGYYGTSEDDPTAHLIADIRRLARDSS